MLHANLCCFQFRRHPNFHEIVDGLNDSVVPTLNPGFRLDILRHVVFTQNMPPNWVFNMTNLTINRIYQYIRLGMLPALKTLDYWVGAFSDSSLIRVRRARIEESLLPTEVVFEVTDGGIAFGYDDHLSQLRRERAMLFHPFEEDDDEPGWALLVVVCEETFTKPELELLAGARHEALVLNPGTPLSIEVECPVAHSASILLEGRFQGICFKDYLHDAKPADPASELTIDTTDPAPAFKYCAVAFPRLVSHVTLVRLRLPPATQQTMTVQVKTSRFSREGLQVVVFQYPPGGSIAAGTETTVWRLRYSWTWECFLSVLPPDEAGICLINRLNPRRVPVHRYLADRHFPVQELADLSLD